MLSEKPPKNVLTERNKFEIFRIKEELEERYPRIFKTIPVRKCSKNSVKRRGILLL